MFINNVSWIWRTAYLLALVLFSVGIQANTLKVDTAFEQKKFDIAYLRLTNGYWQIWFTDSNGMSHKQLTDDAVDKTRMSWSSDRKQLLYNTNNGQVHILDIDEGRSNQIKLPVVGMYDAIWSPDGQLICFSIPSSLTQSDNDLWLVRRDGSGLRKLLNRSGVSQMPVWSADGRQIIYTQSKGRNKHQLWQLNIETGETEQLSLGRARHFDADINEQDKLVYASNQAGNYDIWLRKKDKLLQKLTEHNAYDAQPALAPYGTEVAFYSQRDDSRRIWVKNMDTGHVRAITPEHVFSRNPAW